MKRLNAKREAIRNQNRIEEQKHISDRADRNAKQKETIQKYRPFIFSGRFITSIFFEKFSVEIFLN